MSGNTDTPDRLPAWQARDTSMYQLLSDQLASCSTSVDLLQLAQTEEFQRAARSLNDVDLDALRAQYASRKDTLDNKAKLDQFDGATLTIVSVVNWETSRFPLDDGSPRPGVTIKFSSDTPPDDPRGELGTWKPDREYTAMNTSPAIVRFCNSFAKLPTSDSPIRGRFHQEPVTDPARAKAGQKMWKVDRLVERTTMGIPF